MSFCYLPILKWKQGEQTALKEYPNELRECLLPIIEFLPIKIPAQSTLAAAFNAEVPIYVKKLKAAKFDTHPVGVDLSLFHPNGSVQPKMVATFASRLRANGIYAIPVIHPAMVFNSAVDLPKLAEFDKVIFRFRPTTIIPEQLKLVISTIKDAIGTGKELHVIVDTHDIVAADPAGIAAMVDPYIVALDKISYVKTITFAGGSFPMSMQGISQGTTQISRIEWRAYQALVSSFEALRFGDYSVTNPVLMEVADPAKMNPSVQIRYTRNDNWLILKGGGSKTSGMGQYNGLCKILVKHADYSGPAFSFGDKKYMEHSLPGSTSGNYMTWRRDATSHHIVFTAKQLKEIL